MSRPFTINRRVEFGDTDMAGIMHFANYFRFMEAAETEFLRSRGLTVSWHDPQRGRLGFPRVKVDCEFLAPARFEDLLTIAVIPERVGRKSITYRFEFARDGQILALGRITTVFCARGADDQLEALEIPANIRGKLEA